MTQNTWYTVARTPDSECTGRVSFSIGESSLSFDVFIQYGNISISIVSAVVEADTVFSMRVRSYAGFCYVDVKSSREYSSSPSVSVSQTLGTLVVIPFTAAGDGKQECIVTTDAWAPAPVSETYVTIDRIEAITALKYFEDGLAIGNRDAYWVLSYGSGGVFINGNRILVTSDLNNYATQSWVLGKNYITASALTGYVNGGTYNSNTKNIELKHDSTVVAQIDATAFIKDGMVDTVVVENGYLVITFNTDSGKEPISIPLTDLFDPTNYYTKSDINTLLGNYVTLNTSQVITAEKYFSSALAIPLSAPSSPTSGRTYLYAGSGAYAEESSGGVADVFPLTITKNGSTWLTYNPGVAAGSFNLSVPTRVSELTNDTGFITSSALSGYATQSWVEGKGYITSSALNGYATQSWVEGKGYITSSALDGYVNDFEVTGNGNAVTTGSKSGKKITLTKGDTFVDLTSAQTITGAKKHANVALLNIPATLSSADIESGKTYLYAGTGEYSVEPTGGVADVYTLTLKKGATSLGTYDPAGPDDQTIDLASAFSGYATETYVGNQIAALNLGTASQKDYTTSVSQNGTDLPTSGAVYSAIAAAVTSALHYRGISSTALTDGGTETATIGGQSLTAQAGDVVIYGGFEFLWELNSSNTYCWHKLGDDTSYALKTVQISAGTGLTGGGDLTTSRTISLSSATQTSLGKADTAVQPGDHKALTLKVGTTTVQADYNALAAKTYTISKQNLTDTIGNTTYAVYNADGYVPTTRKVNGHALSADVTVTKGDVGLGNVENTALSTWAGTSNITTLGTITTGTWNGTAIANAYLANSSVTINGKSVSLGGSVSLNLDDIGDGTTKTWSRIVFTDTDQTITGTKKLKSVSLLNIPTSAPASADIESGKIYLYSSAGEYSETPSGSGTGDIYSLTVTKNGSPWLSYDPSSAAVSTNLTIGWSDLTEDSTHKFVSQTEKDTWNAKLDSVPLATSSVIGGFLYGDPIDTMLVMNDGYLAVDLVSLVATTQSIVDAAVTGLTPKVQAIPYIVGPDTDTTAGTWTGTYTGITALTEGLTIVYVAHVAGATTTTLNINGLGAKTCYWTGTSKMTTQYPVGTPILLTYHNNGWRRADANTTYSAGTKALFDAGTNTSNRVWSASVLASAVAPIVHEHDWTDINNAPAFITADALDGYATETYVGNQIAALNLGTASQKDYTTSVAQNGTDLPTSGAVYSAIAAAVTSALHYRGISSVALTDGGTETAVIGGESLVAQAGDVVIYNGFEFLWENSKWNKLGDDTSYALKTITISAGTGLTGGGDLTAARTISLSTSTQTDIGKGVTAYGWGNHASAGYLPLSGGTMTGTLYARDIIPASNSSWALGSSSVPWTGVYTSEIQTGDIGVSGTVLTSLIPDDEYDLGSASSRWNLYAAEARISSLLAIPTTAPSAVTSGEVYLWASSLGEYSETPGGGGTGDIYALTITKNGSAWLSYNPGVASVSANLTIGWSDLTPDANHRFLTDTLISTWNGKQDAISDLSTIRTNAGNGNTAYGWGDHSQAGYLTSYTETDPVFSASAASGITSSNISTWNGKYAKPSTGIPKTDLASAVQTSLGLADTALQSVPLATDSTIGGFKTGNVNQTYLYFDNDILKVSDSAIADYLSGEGYFDLPTWQDIQNTPTTLSGYGITDAKIANGTITLGNSSITPLTSFTETDPTVPSWAKASSKPAYSLTEITGTDDLQAIEALSGTSGFLKKTAANTWSLDTSTYLTSVAFGDLTSHPTTLSGYGITDAISAVTSTDNAVARFNGTDGAIQNSGVLIDDSDNLSLPLGSSSSFSANSKLIIGKAWLGTNTAGALSYGIISGSAYNSYFAFEGTGLRPANSSSAGDNKLNIGTSTVRFKNAYFGGTINTAGADISDSLSIPTDAPSSTTSGKIYLYASSTGSYAVEPWYGFNQLVENGDFASTSGWSMPYSGPTRTVANNILTLTCGTSNNYRPQVYHLISVAANHKIYYTYTIKITTSSPASQRNAFLYSSSGSQYIPTTYSSDSAFADWKKVSAIVTTTRAYTRIYIGRMAASSAPLNQGDTVQIKNVMIMDLTEMFGENVPTVEQFEAMYPQDYYDYSPIE